MAFPLDMTDERWSELAGLLDSAIFRDGPNAENPGRALTAGVTRRAEALVHSALADVYRELGEGHTGAEEVAIRYTEAGGLQAGAAWLRHEYLKIGREAPTVPLMMEDGGAMEDPLTTPDLRLFIAACWASAAAGRGRPSTRRYTVRVPRGQGQPPETVTTAIPALAVPPQDVLAWLDPGLGRSPGHGSYWLRSRHNGISLRDVGQMARFGLDNPKTASAAAASVETLVRFVEGRGLPPESLLFLTRACAASPLHLVGDDALSPWPGWTLDHGTFTPEEADDVVEALQLHAALVAEGVVVPTNEELLGSSVRNPRDRPVGALDTPPPDSRRPGRTATGGRGVVDPMRPGAPLLAGSDGLGTALLWLGLAGAALYALNRK